MERLRFRFCVAWAIGVCCLTLAQESDALEGKVIDGSTGKPLAGVYVIGAWQTNIGIPGKSTSGCSKLEVGRTDTQGRFALSTWSGSVLAHLFGDENLNVYYYMRGYRWEKGSEALGETVVIIPDTRSALERIGHISELAGDADCGSGDNQVKVALPLYHVMYDEAAALASSKAERRVLGTITFKIEVLEIGYQRAIDNVMRGDP
jgi:hypothetical protein